MTPLGLTPLAYELRVENERLRTQVSVLAARNRWLRARLRVLEAPSQSWPAPVAPPLPHLWEGLDSYGTQRCTGCGLLSRAPEQVVQPCAEERRRQRRSVNHAAGWMKRKDRANEPSSL